MHFSGLQRHLVTRTVLAILLGATLIVFAGCSSTSNKTPFMEKQENVSFGANELRVRLYDYASFFSGAVEQTADDIADATDDPVIDRRALQWKISATAEVFNAAFSRDPLGAFTDVWAFSKQMLQFLDTGAGQDLFGDRQPDAVATARILERRAHALGQMGTISGDISPLEGILDPWVEEHPLRDLQFIRESTTPFWAEYVNSQGGGMKVVGRMEDSMMDMVARMDILADNLRKQARWETELLLSDALTTGEFGQFLARVDTIDVNIDRIRIVLDDLEPILSRQIQALMITGGELTERERKLAMKFWGVERKIMFARIESIQTDIFEKLSAERALIMKEIEASAGTTVNNSMAGMKSLVDHLVLRLAQLAAGVLLLTGFMLLVVWRLKSKKS